jgi:hypothetical protein
VCAGPSLAFQHYKHKRRRGDFPVARHSKNGHSEIHFFSDWQKSKNLARLVEKRLSWITAEEPTMYSPHGDVAALTIPNKTIWA